MSSSSRADARAGFTLVEVLVALVLAVMLGGVIFQVVQGESRFATVQSAREEVQQNSRGALEILGSELRSVQRAGLVYARADSITFFMPRVWGVSCGGGTGTTLPVIFPAAGGTAFDLNTASGLLADTGTVAVPAWGPHPLASARASGITLTAQNPALGAAGNACAGIRATAGGTLLSGFTVGGSSIPRAPAGNTVYLYQMVTYRVAQQGTEWWLYRTLGSGTSQPLAGPLDGATGLALVYYDATGATIASPITTLATLKTVARVGITVRTRSRARGSANLTDTQATSITLRNQ
ncbi:MAG TPA: prepilin-type N-terminal cleavage/methylation domain-containing protein [Longimicrobium sp.]|jgi:prepilin-type N-terminal cleavage/methylation domain-containing protein|nr:prepilin-type N-terminal cleavage/methylation domain-containing protein [Longimicrobium sp.]